MLQVKPSIELKVSATNFALSASEDKIEDFWALKLSYDGSPGWGGLTTQSMQAWPTTKNKKVKIILIVSTKRQFDWDHCNYLWDKVWQKYSSKALP